MSYKTIEQPTPTKKSNWSCRTCLFLLNEAGVSGYTAGDGTVYSLQAGTHYRSSPGKHDHSYRYVSKLVDLETIINVAYGYSNVSEKAAFRKAIDFVERAGLPLHSARLNKYYNSRKKLKELGADVGVFVLP